MRKVEKMWPVGLFYLLATSIVLLGHWAAGDSLLFESDLWSLGIYVTAMSLALTLPLGLIALAFLLLPAAARARVLELLGIAIATLICATFMAKACSLLPTINSIWP